MPISIKNAETEHLARQLAKETGESITEAITKSLQDRLQRLKGRRGLPPLQERLAGIFERLDALPRLDTRADEEILGYDENGLPTSDGEEPGSGH
jgi:antitoxin VapB